MESNRRNLSQRRRRDTPAERRFGDHLLTVLSSVRLLGLASVLPIKPDVTAATFALAEDNKLGIAKSTPKRLRFLVSNLGTGSSAATYRLDAAETASCGSGTYSAVPTDSSGHWQVVGTTYFADGGCQHQRFPRPDGHTQLGDVRGRAT